MRADSYHGWRCCLYKQVEHSLLLSFKLYCTYYISRWVKKHDRTIKDLPLRYADPTSYIKPWEVQEYKRNFEASTQRWGDSPRQYVDACRSVGDHLKVHRWRWPSGSTRELTTSTLKESPSILRLTTLDQEAYTRGCSDLILSYGYVQWVCNTVTGESPKPSSTYNPQCEFGTLSETRGNSFRISTTDRIRLYGINQDARTTDYSYCYAHRDCSWEQNKGKHHHTAYCWTTAYLRQKNTRPTIPLFSKRQWTEFTKWKRIRLFIGTLVFVDNITYFAIVLETRDYSFVLIIIYI